jgi:hypothetical protein
LAFFGWSAKVAVVDNTIAVVIEAVAQLGTWITSHRTADQNPVSTFLHTRPFACPETRCAERPLIDGRVVYLAVTVVIQPVAGFRGRLAWSARGLKTGNTGRGTCR